MRFDTASSPHSVSASSLTKVMSLVLLGLLPGVAALWWYFGWGVIINIILASSTAVVAEAAVLKLRNKPIAPALSDLSAVVTACLLAVALPPLLPWWQTVLGTLFAIVLVKQLFGGIGYNPFNPAMAGYVLLLISFPTTMTLWLSAADISTYTLNFGQTFNAIFSGQLPNNLLWDSVSGATPLDNMRTLISQNKMVEEVLSGSAATSASSWQIVNIAFIIGGIFLMAKRVITWRIPVSLIVSLFLISGFFWAVDPDIYASPSFHLLSGGTMLAAFFIATDPVTASTTPRGQIIYGALIAVFIYVIRAWGGYPDAVAFAVLLLNMAAPTIDYYTKPRTFGAGKSS